MSEREPQPLTVTPHAGGARPVLGNTGPSRSESADIANAGRSRAGKGAEGEVSTTGLVASANVRNPASVQTPSRSESAAEIAAAARAFVRTLDKYEAGLLAWRDVTPFLDALRRAAA